MKKTDENVKIKQNKGNYEALEIKSKNAYDLEYQNKSYKCIIIILLILILVIIFISISLFITKNKKVEISLGYEFYSYENSTLCNDCNITYYIASTIINIEKIKDIYIGEMKKLINILGPQNVIVSIIENGDSKDNTNKILFAFQQYLNKIGTRNLIHLNHTINRDKTNDAGYDRIVFYAKLRNKAMDYLYEIPDLNFNNTLIINFNDIVFSSDDVIRLIKTNNGNYDVACALDFIPHGFYDAWTTYDFDGYSPSKEYPYFHDPKDIKAMENNDTIRVFSCWNGLNIHKANNYKNKKIKYRYSTIDEMNKRTVNLTCIYNPGYESECTLINLDFFTEGYKHIFVNTEVRVAYEPNIYMKFKFMGSPKKNLTLTKINNERINNYGEYKFSERMSKWYSENKIDL